VLKARLHVVLEPEEKMNYCRLAEGPVSYRVKK
jgi:hypothetical protein